MDNIIVLDVGHFGAESGAVYGDRIESELAFKIVDKLHNKLKPYFKNIYITTGSLKSRTKLANELNADIFVSVHLNATLGASGVETLLYNTTNKESRTYILADRINSKTVEYSKLKNRGLKERKDLWVLKDTKMSACLVECGFIEKDWNNINENIENFSEGIFRGVLKFYGVPVNEKCKYCGK